MGSNSKKDGADTFESSLKNLEGILRELESPDVPLDELVSKFGQAKECLDFCRARLDAAELKIKKLDPDACSDFGENDGE